MTQLPFQGTRGLRVVRTSLLSRRARRTTEPKVPWRTCHLDIMAFRLSDFRPGMIVEMLRGSGSPKQVLI